MYKKVVSFILVSIVMLSGFVIRPASAVNDKPNISATAAVLYCPDTGEVLFEKNKDQKRLIASITKIMTTIITLEQAEVDNKEVTFGPSMYAEGSSMYLKDGNIIRLSELAKGMMMVSGNDAANAAAIAIGGSKEGFAKLMNDKAKQIGMKNSHFVTPSGLDADEHYSTAYDMALLMAYAMENEKFAELTGSKSQTYTLKDETGEVSSTIYNQNKLLKMYDYCIGGKTGYTISAGRTLVSCAEKNGVRLIAVTLEDRDDWNDHINLYEYGFSLISSVELDDTDENISLKVVGSNIDSVNVTSRENSKVVISASDKNKIERIIELPSFVYAPIKSGESVGKVIYKLYGEVIAENELIATENIEYLFVNSSQIDKVKDFISGIFS